MFGKEPSSLILNEPQRVTERDEQIKLDLWLPFCVKYLPTAEAQPHLFVIPHFLHFLWRTVGAFYHPSAPRKYSLKAKLRTHLLTQTNTFSVKFPAMLKCRINFKCRAFIHLNVWSVMFAFGSVFVTSRAIMTSLWSYLWARGFVCDELWTPHSPVMKLWLSQQRAFCGAEMNMYFWCINKNIFV